MKVFVRYKGDPCWKEIESVAEVSFTLNGGGQMDMLDVDDETVIIALVKPRTHLLVKNFSG